MRSSLGLCLWGVALPFLFSCTPMADSESGRGTWGSTPSVAPERFLVFTDGTPAATDAVRASVDRHGGAVVSEVRVAPDLAMLVVSVSPDARIDLERLPGVREVAPDVAPSPADETGDRRPG